MDFKNKLSYLIIKQVVVNEKKKIFFGYSFKKVYLYILKILKFKYSCHARRLCLFITSFETLGYTNPRSAW